MSWWSCCQNQYETLTAFLTKFRILEEFYNNSEAICFGRQVSLTFVNMKNSSEIPRGKKAVPVRIPVDKVDHILKKYHFFTMNPIMTGKSNIWCQIVTAIMLVWTWCVPRSLFFIYSKGDGKSTLIITEYPSRGSLARSKITWSLLFSFPYYIQRSVYVPNY